MIKKAFYLLFFYLIVFSQKASFQILSINHLLNSLNENSINELKLKDSILNLSNEYDLTQKPQIISTFNSEYFNLSYCSIKHNEPILDFYIFELKKILNNDKMSRSLEEVIKLHSNIEINEIGKYMNQLYNENILLFTRGRNIGLSMTNIFKSSDDEFKLITIYDQELDFEVKLSNMRYIEEDNNIIIYNSDNNFININIKLSFNSVVLNSLVKKLLTKLKIEDSDLFNLIKFELEKSHLFNYSNVSSIDQHKLHSNKYFILASNDSVKVLNELLMPRTTFEYNYLISKTYLISGILGIVSDRDVFFTNLLGGNSIILNCHSNSKIDSLYYESAPGYLFIISDLGILTVFATKLSLAKVNTNECKGMIN
jgi:hypothetical protein